MVRVSVMHEENLYLGQVYHSVTKPISYNMLTFICTHLGPILTNNLRAYSNFNRTSAKKITHHLNPTVPSRCRARSSMPGDSSDTILQFFHAMGNDPKVISTYTNDHKWTYLAKEKKLKWRCFDTMKIYMFFKYYRKWDR